MVDVGKKKTTKRGAIAVGKIKVQKELSEIIRKNDLPKGDLFSTAKIAGIFGAKQTYSLIPLCHPIIIDNVEIDISIEDEETLAVTAKVLSEGKTGVEMEALTAVSIACLTIYDMCKSFDKKIVIKEIYLLEKWGGKSGYFKNKKR